MSKKGISLVVLVITIIVLVIITVTVILLATQSNMFENANEAVFRNDLTSYMDVFLQKKMDEKVKELGEFKDTSVNAINNSAGDVTDIKYWIPSISDKYVDKLAIQSGKLVYVGADTTEIAWATELGMIGSIIPPSDDDLIDPNALYTIDLSANQDSSVILSVYSGGRAVLRGTGATYNSSSYIDQTPNVYNLLVEEMCKAANNGQLPEDFIDGENMVADVYINIIYCYYEQYAYMNYEDKTQQNLQEELGEELLTNSKDYTVEESNRLYSTYVNVPNFDYAKASYLIYADQKNYSQDSINIALQMYNNGIIMLTSLEVEEGITNIGNYLFKNNMFMATATLPSTLTEIGRSAFSNNALLSVTIPESVTTVGNAAFRENEMGTITVTRGTDYYSNYNAWFE